LGRNLHFLKNLDSFVCSNGQTITHMRNKTKGSGVGGGEKTKQVLNEDKECSQQSTSKQQNMA
jgi:hypothetical protein